VHLEAVKSPSRRGLLLFVVGGFRRHPVIS
jgi:hypothetical protein